MGAFEGYRYAVLADQLESQILDGTFRAGDKLPSIRSLHARTGLSISTVYQSFIELEKRGMVEPRQKSGYFVKPLLRDLLPAPGSTPSPPSPRKIDINNLAAILIEAMADPDVLQLGGALVSGELLPLKALGNLLKRAPGSFYQENLSLYGHSQGDIELRRQIAKHMAPFYGDVTPEAMVITNGCIEAVTFGLLSVTRPGDAVLVESPTFPWFLQLMEDLNLHALEIPTHPETGVDLSAVDEAVARYPVKACIFIPSFNNPLGFLMPDDGKQALVALMADREIPIIEDDIYGELYFTPSRPTPLKAFDRKGMVLYCASFSKCLAPGLRVGWALPGRYLETFKRIRLNRGISGPGLPQWVTARYLRTGAFERHLRRLRTHLKNQVGNTALAVSRYFPEGTKISAPKGGLALWVQFHDRVDSLQLFRKAIARRIALFPGIMCASGDAYNNCIRISCGMPFTDAIDRGLKTLAGIVEEMM